MLATRLCTLARASSRPFVARSSPLSRRSAARCISSTPRRLASEDPNLPESEVLRKIINHPSAVQSMTELGKMLQEHGLNVIPGEQPSMMQMAKLAMKPGVREAMMKVAQDLKDAGVDVNDPNFINEMSSIINKNYPK